jgi:hypothetical protein
MNFMRVWVTTLFLSIHTVIFSQGWIKINQEDYNVTYKLPRQWEVDGFGSGFGSWDTGGSSVCDCAGTINYGFNRALGMVIYPFEKTANLVKRNFVWNYEFVSSNEVISIQTKILEFKQEISSWKLENGSDEGNMLDDEVWKFTFTGARYGLVVYFWGDKELMKKNTLTIQRIMDSMQLVKL